MRFALAILVATGLGSGLAPAQEVVSAHAGIVHYTEGRVFVGGQQVQRKFGVFPDLQVREVLRTEDGRAEVLLTPGAFLRVGANSSVRMLSRDLTDTRFEVLTGTAMVECDDIPKNSSLTLVYQGRTIQLEKHGLYRLDTDPPRFRVYDGKAVVQAGSEKPLTLKRGKQADLETTLVAQKFNAKQADGFYDWNGVRSGYIASANVSAAQSLYSSGGGWHASGWLWDPWYGAFTFMPAGGVLFNPFGWGFWSPGMVMYAPAPIYGYAPVVAGTTPGTGQPGPGVNGPGTGISRTGGPPAGTRPGGVQPGGNAGIGGVSRGPGAFGGGGPSRGPGPGSIGGGGFGSGASSGGGGFGGGASSGAASSGGGFGGGASRGAGAAGGGMSHGGGVAAPTRGAGR
jgi:hypothetical protein